MSTTTMDWRFEFGDEYDVPELITKIEGIEDFSWHNDVCPSFGRSWRLMGGGGGEIRLRIWVEHPDEIRREYAPESPRFNVNAEAWGAAETSGILAIAGVPDAMDGDLGRATDDVREAMVTFFHYAALISAAIIATS